MQNVVADIFELAQGGDEVGRAVVRVLYVSRRWTLDPGGRELTGGIAAGGIL